MSTQALERSPSIPKRVRRPGESMSTFYIDLAVVRSSDVVLGSYNTTAIAMHFPSGVLVQTYSGFGAADGVAFDPGQKRI